MRAARDATVGNGGADIGGGRREGEGRSEEEESRGISEDRPNRSGRPRLTNGHHDIFVPQRHAPLREKDIPGDKEWSPPSRVINLTTRQVASPGINSDRMLRLPEPAHAFSNRRIHSLSP